MASGIEPIHHALRRRLLGGPPGAALGDIQQPERGDLALDLEGLGVRLSPGRADAVHRQRHFPSLQALLQGRLRILGPLTVVTLHDLRAEEPTHRPQRCIEAGVQMHRTDHRLQRIGQHRGPLRAAGARLALGHAQQR